MMPIVVRQILHRGRRIQTAANWYEPTEFIQSMMACFESAEEDATTNHPWPKGCEFAFVLTHNVETSVCMRHIARIADVEECLGLRSSWNLIPYKYRIDRGLVRDLQSRGFEIGIHDYDRNGQLHSSRRTFERRAVGINQAIKKYGVGNIWPFIAGKFVELPIRCLRTTRCLSAWASLTIGFGKTNWTLSSATGEWR
jgi:hypothetical protein